MKICRVMESKKGMVHVQVLDNGHLCWSRLQLNENSMQLSTGINTIPAEDILNVKVAPLQQTTAPPSEKNSGSLRTHSLLVYYVKQYKKQILRMASCQFHGSLAECEHLKEDLNRKRKGHTSPVRKFLALINPVSGAGKSLHIYQTAVAPILEACDITCDVVTSTKSDDLKNTAKTHNLREYNGLLVLGGDGSLNEVVNGLLIRAMEEAGRNINSKSCQLMPVTVPLGLVPTGTGNYVCQHVQGNVDVITSVIHVVRGHSKAMNAVTVHVQDRLLCVAYLVLHIGFVGDIIHKGEMHRWMGQARYQVASHITLFQRRLMAVDLTCETVAGCSDTPRPVQQPDDPNLPPHPRPVQQPDDPNLPPSSKTSSSADASSSDSGTDRGGEPLPSISSPPGTSSPTSRPGVSGTSSRGVSQSAVYDEHIEGDVYNIFLPITQFVTPEGRLVPRLGANSMSMVVVKNCSFPEFLKHFTKVRDNTGGMNDFSFVEYRQVMSFKLEMTSEQTQMQTWYINSDGESVSIGFHPIYFKLHQRVFLMFGPAP